MGFWDSIFAKRQTAARTVAAYRQYCKAFDREVTVKDLDGAIGRQSDVGKKALDEAWAQYQEGLAGWKAHIQVSALNYAAEIKSKLPPAFLTDCCFTFLLDQSGSMRGQNMLLAAAAIDCAQNFLRSMGCSTEILGFTTSSWKGGKSREKWARQGKIPLPGRLCDLLHIIYVSADAPLTGVDSWTLRPMLRADLPKENVDGEALEWAVRRLKKIESQHKFLVVISDGAPVDDSTLHENGSNYLSDHLRSVISSVEANDEIKLSAIGINHDVAAYYRSAVVVQTPDDLGSTLTGMIKDQLISTGSSVGVKAP